MKNLQKRRLVLTKRSSMFIEFYPTDKQAEALKYWTDDITTEI